VTFRGANVRHWVVGAAVTGTLVATALLVLLRHHAPDPLSATLSIAEALGPPTLASYARATAPRPFTFPVDHGPHPEYRTEWWYWTGNVADASGRHFGFQLTFFRRALAPSGERRASAWAATQVYMAHFALTDSTARRFSAHQRLVREALGLAGAWAQPFLVWAEDWSAAAVGHDPLPLRLRAADGDVAIDLVLDGGKPAVLQGDRGLSRKGPETGNASYYYSLTRMPAHGSIVSGGRRFDVKGLAWMDREWSTSTLGAERVGWDWFALQLDDGRDLMFYRFRRADGGPDPFSAGVMVGADGTGDALGPDDVRIEVLDSWASPRSRIAYPARWRLTLPRERLSLEVVPRLADQEHMGPVRYWEGAVRVRGRAGERPLQGDGYVELVGYAPTSSPRVSPRSAGLREP
jgi:predicted secreted hydrolase